MSSSHTIAPPSPFPCRATDESSIAGPQTALSRPVEMGAPAVSDAGAVTMPVIAPPLAAGSGW
jgi:hypothetical protein